MIGYLYFLLGSGVLAFSWRYFTGVDKAYWVMFALAYVVLSFRSVEVNDKLYASSSIMPVLTAGVVFALLLPDDPGARWSPVFAMAAMAAAALFVPEDFKQRRVLQPSVNFGQLSTGAALAGLVIVALVPRVDLQAGENLHLLVVAGVGAAFVYSMINYWLVWTAIRATYGRRGVLRWSGMLTIVSSQMLMGALGGILGGVLVATSESAVPLILAIYVLGHMSVVAYARLREAHESTLKGFVKTLEARDLYTRGHTERVAYFCQLIGEQLGFTGTQLEQIRWAALIHDVGKLAVPVEVMKKRGRLDDDEYRRLRVATHRVDDLLSEVDFLKPMVVVASGCHPRLPEEDFGQVGHTHTTTPNLEQKVLAVADSFDAMTSVRSYRMATSQQAAIAILRDDDNLLYDNAVLDALERGLIDAGERYGPPDLMESEEVASTRA